MTRVDGEVEDANEKSFAGSGPSLARRTLHPQRRLAALISAMAAASLNVDVNMDKMTAGGEAWCVAHPLPGVEPSLHAQRSSFSWLYTSRLSMLPAALFPGSSRSRTTTGER